MTNRCTTGHGLMDTRGYARSLAQKYVSERDPLGWFEPLYAAAAGDASAIPWADLKPNVNLVDWLDRHPVPPGRSALTVGCGLGDDSEELARRRLEVTGFDISPTAVDWCRRRFHQSRVRYVVADLLDPPAAWAHAFDLVVESYTLQVLPPELRQRAVHSLSGFLRPGGELLIICRGRSPDEPEGQIPWPLTRAELTQPACAAQLAEQTFEDYLDDEDPPVRRFRSTYRRTT